MSSNNWSYSNLGQRERLKLIREGNEDVYNTEKNKNKVLKEIRENLGLSTYDVDNWDKIIDSANSAYRERQTSRPDGLPKFMSTRKQKIYDAYNEYMDGLENQAEKTTNKALQKAQSESAYLAEWLANNGYSKNGHTSKKESSQIEEELFAVIDEVTRNLQSKSKTAREKYLEMMRNSRK